MVVNMPYVDALLHTRLRSKYTFLNRLGRPENPLVWYMSRNRLVNTWMCFPLCIEILVQIFAQTTNFVF